MGLFANFSQLFFVTKEKPFILFLELSQIERSSIDDLITVIRNTVNQLVQQIDAQVLLVFGNAKIKY